MEKALVTKLVSSFALNALTKYFSISKNYIKRHYSSSAKHSQGPRSTFLSGGAKLDEIFFLGGGDAWEFLFNFSKVTDNAFITIKLIIFLHIFSDVAIGYTDINLQLL